MTGETSTAKTRTFLVEFSVKDGPDDIDAASDELLEALTSGTLPEWVFSVDAVMPNYTEEDYR